MSHGSYRDCSCSVSNPDPSKFKVLEFRQINDYMLVLAKYENCTNYGGLKLLAYKNLYPDDLEKQLRLDPHFNDNGELSPVARFEPTKTGWKFAVECLMKQCAMSQEGW